MSKKLLKNVDWIISVPDKNPAENIIEKMNSSQFTIEHNGNITKWKLTVNFNDRKSQHFSAYLTPISYDIDLDMEITFIVLDWINAIESKSVKTGVIPAKDWKKGQGWGDSKLLAHQKLFSEQSRFVKDGKLHLIVAIKEQENNEKTRPESSMNQLEAVRFGAVFDTITSDNDDLMTLQPAADGVKLKASRNIIAQKSPVFAAMFETDMLEKSGGVVEIIDFSGKVIKELLRFMYYGIVESIEDVDMELYNAAKVYQVEGLREVCLKSIESRVELSNVFEIIPFADLHGEDDLFEFCCEIIARFFTIDSIQEQIKKLGSKVQIRVLTESLKLRCNAFCSVTIAE